MTERERYLLVASRLDAEEAIFSPESLLEGRLARGAWPLNSRTNFVEKFKEGDLILFYVALGKKGYVGASATIAGKPWMPTNAEVGQVRAPGDEYLAPMYYVRLSEVKRFGRPVPMIPLLGKLDLFSGVGRFWGTRLQGGAKRLTPHDYGVILEAASIAR